MSSIPLSEIAKFTSNPELQKNIQLANQIIIKVQQNLENFFRSPEVQNSLKAIHSSLQKLQIYLNDPIVKKNIESYLKTIVEISNNNEFKSEYIKRREITNSVEEDTAIFKSMVEERIEAPPVVLENPILNQNIDGKTINPITWTLTFLTLIFNLYIGHLDSFKDLNEAYEYVINGVQAEGVTKTRINLRDAPNFESEKLFVLPRETVLKIYKDSYNGWVKVSVIKDGLEVEGFVNEAYVKKLKNKYDFDNFFSTKTIQIFLDSKEDRN
ncbi:SH3 domain-containing protein [Acinetobacter baumannii]|uniref:SH3 domain-containing protein n=1 Tax=Acinetobacter baumannii TaxID=470 RepID=UPI0023426F88|nr:SH3 domain-containing protein [Acinetobacter baumannii]HCE0841689.1 SH3 domain-containing protein [Acinetobacter baumannii]